MTERTVHVSLTANYNDTKRSLKQEVNNHKEDYSTDMADWGTFFLIC